MPDKESYLTGPQVCQRYGITDMTLWRWLKNPDLGFPRPLKINRRRYFREAEVIEWERRQAVAGKVAA